MCFAPGFAREARANTPLVHRLKTKTSDYPLTPTSFIHYSQVVTIELDNVAYDVSPTANTMIDTSHSVDLVIDGGDCHSYTKQPASTINGHLRAFKNHFWKWELVLEPSTHTHNTKAMPACRSYSSLGDAGDVNASWTLDTGNLDVCGYTLRLIAYDWTIVNSNASAAHLGQKSVGFSVT